MRYSRLVTTAAAVSLGALAAPPALAADIRPFGVAPVTNVELDMVRGGAPDRSFVNRMTREQLEAFDRQTAQIMGTTFDNWLFDVALPLIAANIDR